MPRIPVAGTLSPGAAKRSVMPTGPRSRFSVATTCDGYEVVDSDGRAVSNSYEFATRPLEIAAELNGAAAINQRALARKLGVLLADDDSETFFQDDEYEYVVPGEAIEYA